MTVSIVLGQGIAGSVLAWTLHRAGHDVHIVDRNDGHSASNLAAGLITPFTGRRLSKAADFDTSLNVAAEFYRRIEAETGCCFYEQSPSIRLFQDEAERDQFLRNRADRHRDEIELLNDSAGSAIGFRMLHAARLHVPAFLKTTRNFFMERARFHEASVNLAQDIEITPEQVKLLKPAILARRIFFCQGYQPTANPWFPGIPDAPARGEILTLRIPDRKEQSVVHRGVWLAPESAAMPHGQTVDFVLGATYDRDDLTASVTQAGRTQLLMSLRTITNVHCDVTGHFAAVRASTRDRRPLGEIHREYPQLAILNGMGSKASLLAPITAERLLSQLAELSETKVFSDTSRHQKKPVSLTKMAHTIMQRTIREGDTVIDATAGNGHDTRFLAKCVSQEGRVISIDIQSEAIAATRTLLVQDNLRNVEQHQGDHSVILSQLADQSARVRAVMFNLGYRPGGDKRQTTQPETTVSALTSAVQLLETDGVMTVIAYRGHDGGREEAEAVQNCLRKIESVSGTLDLIAGSDDHRDSPILYVYRR